MGKRKREVDAPEQRNGVSKKPNADISEPANRIPIVVQIITGSYERVLHGFQATISDPKDEDAAVPFVDTFLFNAHSSAIRCLALSPLPEPSTLSENLRVILASGGTDERVNLYSLSASPLAESERLPSVPTLAGNKILENPANRELGSLLQHNSSITSLHFPTRSKLLSAAEDNTISISRTKDFEVVSTIKAPRPKIQGRPSGDTAPPGGLPAGVNDFAVHPSMKLMVSVGKGERCMRLWNLVTGKKAGVLNFTRETLESVKESKYSSGEGRRIEWSPDGDEFAVAFERGVIVYGADSVPSCKILPTPLTKIHQMRYLGIKSSNKPSSVLAVSTEDGRIVFYSTNVSESDGTSTESGKPTTIPDATLVSKLGGKDSGVSGRIKDFEVVSAPGVEGFLVVTASSDGAVRIWSLELSSLLPKKKSVAQPRQVGRLLGTYETGNRVTCLKAFVMLPVNPDELEGDEGLTEAEEDDYESLSNSEDSD
ncbi:putative 60s ribosome biogenesis protein mak11 [Phaeomoniella chlamydospora]|uniref:Putative 60s ribosome biogenesis protein mak11 n=1 Tax=Phaeomoniella chlamydospora TaxID=158046 RepID=A0A0G2GDA0_PHACM|nr:putative 60s ribosome biogenesis protein mak11 [Phaeomoniella chlamydospora]